MVALMKMPRIDSASEGSDRRMFPRTPAEGQARGHRVDHTVSARRNPRLSLDLRDLSFGGVGAVSDSPLEQGETLAVAFPRRSTNPPWSARGRVVRCEPTAFGYRIAIEFAPLLAA
jgi:hypothetical protein